MLNFAKRALLTKTRQSVPQFSYFHKQREFLMRGRFSQRLFSTNNSDEPEVIISTDPTGETTSTQNENQANNQLETQYRLVPMRDHPIFPGSSMATAITKEQYDVSRMHSLNLILKFLCQSSLKMSRQYSCQLSKMMKSCKIICLS